MIQLLVIAKAPVPGRVKTRLCPPCTPTQAATIAAAALADTLRVVSSVPATRHALVIAGNYDAPIGWRLIRQRGDGLAQRLANAFIDTALRRTPALLVGMDTPQITADLLVSLIERLHHFDAVLAPAADGGWWALALRNPLDAVALAGVPMSTAETAMRTADALRAFGLRLGYGPVLRDVDTADDARKVVDECPGSAFAEAVRAHLPLLMKAAAS